MALSPQGPSATLPPDRDSEGWITSSWDAMLGAPDLHRHWHGHDAGGEDPFGRRDAHYFMTSEPPVPRYQLFVCDATIKHMNFSLEQQGPAEFEKTLKGAAIAFLDAVIKGLPDARASIDLEERRGHNQRRGCEWDARTWTPVEFDEPVYVPVTHRTAQVPLEVWYPDGLTGALPVVVWSHGGGPVPDEFNSLAQRWLTTFASAGYVALKVNTLDRNISGPTPDFTHCRDLGYPDTSDACTALSAASPLRDRALDTIAALGALPTIALPTGATLDVTRVVLGGWSGGAGMPLALAGASRNLWDPSRTSPPAHSRLSRACSNPLIPC